MGSTSYTAQNTRLGNRAQQETWSTGRSGLALPPGICICPHLSQASSFYLSARSFLYCLHLTSYLLAKCTFRVVLVGPRMVPVHHHSRRYLRMPSAFLSLSFYIVDCNTLPNFCNQYLMCDNRESRSVLNTGLKRNWYLRGSLFSAQIRSSPGLSWYGVQCRECLPSCFRNATASGLALVPN